ncbi:hypothetical protein M404DRAFT_28357 [Pisolithus tinctorius Marx 270]|uniref:Uncharacterized protein n=1 Tax=Pisolithus tinctorius Marx 270 TaxID=870435 RepID=A0A0C3JWT2_PISTI|nr:hypothetical protein M404DRAFT_28357 [Pisolithus tinctorius Marx 270]
MSESRPITMTDKNDEGWAVVDWTQVSDDAIQYDTDDEEEVMKAKLKERKRAEREKAKVEKAASETKERRVHKEEERWEAKHKCKAKAGKSDEASAGGEARGEVKRVVMDPSCTHCTQAQVICKFLIGGNKKRVACMCCNQSKGKCWWPGDGKDAEASPRAALKADKGKKRKANEEMPEPGPSQKKQVKSRPTEVLEIDEPKASGSGVRKARAGGFSGLEDKLKQLIDVAGLIANNLAGLFKLQEAVVENSGCITDMLEAIRASSVTKSHKESR